MYNFKRFDDAELCALHALAYSARRTFYDLALIMGSTDYSLTDLLNGMEQELESRGIGFQLPKPNTSAVNTEQVH